MFSLSSSYYCYWRIGASHAHVCPSSESGGMKVVYITISLLTCSNHLLELIIHVDFSHKQAHS
jgi:Trk-type K+ transport system membrane component